MQRQIESTKGTFADLKGSTLPAVGLALRDKAQRLDVGFLRESDRSGADGFRKGQDWTYTENRGHDYSGTRAASDTPRPRSPSPHRTGEQLTPKARYEHTHQSAHRFTGKPGTTVHAPTQGNQVADTEHERHVASGLDGSFILRRDTYEASSIYSARKTTSGWEVMHSSYRRRKVAQASASSSSSSSPSSSSSSSSASSSLSTGKPSPAKRQKNDR